MKAINGVDCVFVLTIPRPVALGNGDPQIVAGLRLALNHPPLPPGNPPPDEGLCLMADPVGLFQASHPNGNNALEEAKTREKRPYRLRPIALRPTSM